MLAKPFKVSNMVESLKGEIWLPLPNDADYMVSNIGRVASRKRGQWMLQSCYPNGRGYYITSVGKGMSRLVHRLIALAFLPNPENKEFVDHINTISTDNRVENLRWATRKENNSNPLTLKHMSECRIGKNMGAENHFHKEVYQYTLDGKFLRKWGSAADAARMYGAKKQSHITACCTGERRQSLGFIWRYEPGEVSPIGRTKKAKKVARVLVGSDTIDKVFDSITDASIEMCGSRKYCSNIVGAIRGRHKSSYGYKWLYV